MRTTKKEVNAVFNLWVQSVNGHIAKDHKDVGGYTLDYNPFYGGYCIGQICNQYGGESIFYDSRMPAREFVKALRYSMRTLEQARLNKI